MTYSAEVTADAPVAWWRTADPSGTTLTDSSGNGRNLSLAGSYTLGATSLLVGDANACVDFSTSGYGSIAHASWQNPSGAFTLECLYRPDTLSVDRQLVIKDVDASPLAEVSYRLYVTSAGKASALIVVGGVLKIVTGATTLATGTTYHLAATYDSTNLGVYVNGVLDGTTSAAGTYNAGTSPLRIGGTPTFPSNGADGRVDEVAIYGAALSAARLLAHYNAAQGIETMTLAGQVPAVTGAFILDAVQDVTLAGQIGAVVGAFAVDAVQGVELAGTIAGPTGDFNMLVGNVDTVELAGTVPGVEGAFTLDAIQTVSLAGTIGGVTGAFTLQTGYEVTLAGQVGAIVGAFTLTQDDVEAITLAGTLPAVTGSFSLETSYISDPGPQNGISLGAYGVAEWEPAVEAPPAYPLIVHNNVAAEIYTSVAMSGTRPTINGYARTYRINHRTRVVVAGRDLTYWRGIPTPPPSFGLVEPLLYGSGSLRLPQVAVPFEKAGQGSLSWLKPGANVKIQRVNTETGLVAVTDWKGFLGVEDYSGGELRFQLEGEVTGRASMMDKQPPIFKRRQDLGFHWYDDVTDTGQPFKPRGGPDTGINIYTYGGMGLLDHMQDLSAKGVNQDGAQWTCMPNSNGVYRVARKDLTTIAGTVYFTDSHTVADLRRDPAEETNRVFGTGVTPSGRRVKGAVFPVLADTNPPPFPGFMTQGDSGSDVDALIARLANTGYLSWDDRPGAYDSDVTRAVRRLQDDAELSETGNVNQATWEAMFDVEVTGYDIGGSHIEPLAQRSYTRRYRRTPDGNIIGRNRRYDRKRLKSDKTIDFGTSMNRQQIDRAAEGELTPDDANNWAGTITFHTGGLVNGTHIPGTPIVGADVKRARSLQPGDNLWAPLWDGGTVFHVSGVDVSEDGIVSATVDTQARDTMKVWEVLARNRENRRDPARAWIRTHRSSHFVKDAITEFDEVGGVITDTDLAEGWNVLPVVAGMAGAIGQIRLEVDLPAEFVCAVFGRRVWPRWLAHRVGNPLSELGSQNWTNAGVRRRLDNRVILYSAGTDQQPCGYSPGTKQDGFSAVTGVWSDDAGFPYRTFQNSCVLWLAVYVPTPVTLQGGRVMWNQIEAGS